MGENLRPFPIQPWVGEGKLSQKMLGEIITWKIQGVAISHADLLAGLMASDLDCDVAKELAPRNAFARACSKLIYWRRQVIRCVCLCSKRAKRLKG